MPALRGPRVLLRPVAEADIAALLEVLREPSVAEWWGPIDEDEERAEFGEDAEVERLVIEVDGEIGGFLQYSEEADPKYRHAGIDIALGGRYQGSGMGPEALSLVARHLIVDRGHHRLVIDPAASNERAIRAYAKVGFRPVGLMRRY